MRSTKCEVSTDVFKYFTGSVVPTVGRPTPRPACLNRQPGCCQPATTKVQPRLLLSAGRITDLTDPCTVKKRDGRGNPRDGCRQQPGFRCAACALRRHHSMMRVDRSASVRSPAAWHGGFLSSRRLAVPGLRPQPPTGRLGSRYSVVSLLRPTDDVRPPTPHHEGPPSHIHVGFQVETSATKTANVERATSYHVSTSKHDPRHKRLVRS